MDPVLQTFQQQNSGSSEGQGFGNFYVQGRQLNLSQQHLDLAKAAEARAQKEQSALLPLQKQLLQYKAINDGLQLGKIATDADVTTEMNSSLPKVNDLLARFMRSPDGFNDSNLLSEYNTLFTQVPWVFSAGNGAKVTQGIEAARAHRTMWVSALEHEQDLKNRGLYLQDIQTGKGGAETLRFGLRDDDLKKQRVTNEIARLRNEAVRLSQSGDRNALANVRLRIQALEQGVELDGMPQPAFGQTPIVAPDSTAPSSQNPTASVPESGLGTAPDALQPSTNSPPSAAATPVSLQRVERPPTTTTTGALQKQSIDVDMSLKQLGDIRDEIVKNPDAFGPIGKLKKWGEIANGLFDANADARVNKIQQKAGQVLITIARSLRPDSGNMSRFELDRMRDLGDLTEVMNVPSVALAKADALISLQVAKKLRIAKTLHEPITEPVLRAIDPGDIKGLFNDGLLSPPDVVRAVNLLPKDEAMKLQQSLLNGR